MIILFWMISLVTSSIQFRTSNTTFKCVIKWNWDKQQLHKNWIYFAFDQYIWLCTKLYRLRQDYGKGTHKLYLNRRKDTRLSYIWMNTMWKFIWKEVLTIISQRESSDWMPREMNIRKGSLENTLFFLWFV